MPNNKLIPLEWDEDAVRMLSIIAPQDEEKARVWWELYAPLAYQAILDAGILADRDDLPRSDIEFERWMQDQTADVGNEEKKKKWWMLGIFFFFTASRYVSMQNVMMPAERVRYVLDRTLINARADMQLLCDGLRHGGLALDDWQIKMTDIIRVVHTASAVLAYGGFGRMSPDAWAGVQNGISEQLDYLTNFANQIGSGQQRLDGTLCRRMRLYLEAGRRTYHIVETGIMEGNGYDQYRNVLGMAEHCSECVEETDKGWVAIGELSEIGTRLCMTNCQCHYEYRMEPDGDDPSLGDNLTET